MIPRVVEEKVGPEDEARRLEDAHHFGGDLPPQRGLEDRGEHGGLQHDIERGGRKRQLGGVAAQQRDGGGEQGARAGDLAGQQLHAGQVLRPGSPFDEVPQSTPGAGTDFENAPVDKRQHAVAPQREQHEALALLRLEHVPHTGPGVLPGVIGAARVGRADAALLFLPATGGGFGRCCVGAAGVGRSLRDDEVLGCATHGRRSVFMGVAEDLRGSTMTHTCV